MTKSVVIAGALASGIGVATTTRFLKDGWHVYGMHTSDQELPASIVFDPGKLTLVKVDYDSRAGLQPILEATRSKPLHAFINVHMLFSMENPNCFDHDAFEKSLFVNLTAPNFLIHSLKPEFQSGASIVVVTSTEGFIGSFGASAYAATKAAIHNIIRTHANNLGGQNVRCNAVAPGWIGGVMDTDEVFNMSRNITPLGRLGSADEVASVIAFLTSDASSFVNGTVITVDGGYSGVDTISKFEFESSK